MSVGACFDLFDYLVKIVIAKKKKLKFCSGSAYSSVHRGRGLYWFQLTVLVICVPLTFYEHFQSAHEIVEGKC